jgi:hypothetical protein
MIWYGLVLSAITVVNLVVPGVSVVFSSVMGLATATAIVGGVVMPRPRRRTPGCSTRSR